MIFTLQNVTSAVHLLKCKIVSYIYIYIYIYNYAITDTSKQMLL